MATKVINKKRKNVEKPLCKYGSSCYQKNSEHRKKFKHPPAKETITKYLTVNAPNDDDGDSDTSEFSLILDEAYGEEKSANTSSDIEDSFSSEPVENVPTVNVEETVDEVFKLMPKDFFDFWKFCGSLNKSKPEDAFSEIGCKLVGVYDLLARKVPKDKKVNLSCHWRYYYDTPEFQTVIKKEGVDLYHIGYFRDDLGEKPTILASNKAAVGSKFTLMGDNIFCAMNVQLSTMIKSTKSKTAKDKAIKLQGKLLKFATQKKYSTDVLTNKTKKRQKKVVAKTFHGLGIVVPVKNDIGYRPLPDSDTVMKSILKKIVTAENERKRLEHEELLDEIKMNVHFANDECDYGMGLELGIDLFCYGDPYFHASIERILPLAYNLLKRPKYALIIRAHLKNRKKGDKLDALDL